MRSVTVLVALIAVVFYLGDSSIAAQQLSAKQEETIRADVNRAFDEYRNGFMADRSDLVARRIRIPWLRLQPAGPVTISRDSEVKTWFENTLRPLLADGYERSEWPILRTCVLNESTAIISGKYIRYRKNGSVIGEYGTSYLFAKSDAGWQIVSTIPHDPGKLVLC
jgi:hypothetical protein